MEIRFRSIPFTIEINATLQIFRGSRDNFAVNKLLIDFFL